MRFTTILVCVCLLLIGCQLNTQRSLLQDHEVQLSAPIISIDSIFFFEAAKIKCTKLEPKSSVVYSKNDAFNKETLSTYENELVINENADLTIHATHLTLKDSDTKTISVRKLNKNASISIDPQSSKAKEPYLGNGHSSLSDGAKGKMNFRSGKEWLGFNKNIIELDISFEKQIYCTQICLSTLVDHNSWIFQPSRIEVISEENTISYLEVSPSTNVKKNKFQFFDLPLNKIMASFKLKIYMQDIPEWHPGKGTTPWFFIDEIIVQ